MAEQDLILLEKLTKERRTFSKGVMDEAKSLPLKIDETELKRELERGRRDLRNLCILTMDSDDTKDVDDGVSIELNEDGHYILGVHIADVANYVKEGSALDNEALNRGTSVYFEDKVIPMLPRQLSNRICSLNVGRDRFALTVMMELDEHGDILNHEIFESVIRVKYKISYTKFYQYFECPSEALKRRFARYDTQLILLKKLASLRRRIRDRRGSIDFDFPEVKVTLDKEKKPVKLSMDKLTYANGVIEEFMLLCNETVAEHFFWYDIPFLYRIHSKPEKDRIDSLKKILMDWGYKLKGKSHDIRSSEIQSMLTSVRNMGMGTAIDMLTLRTMSKACYSSHNDGHYGLALKYYTHFTSPIRRYPDLYIHRIIKRVINGEYNEELCRKYSQSIESVAEDSSLNEREADICMRKRTDQFIAEYMSKQINKNYNGIISGLTSFGMFITLENGAEGLVFYSGMSGYVEFIENKLVAVGYHAVYNIGDKVRVKVYRTNKVKGQIEFLLC